MTYRPATRVAFVAVGRVAKPEDYLSLAETYVAMLDREMQTTFRSTDGPRKAFDARIFTSIGLAEDFVRPHTGGTRTLVFLSEIHKHMAEAIAASDLSLRVVVFTGVSPPEGKVQTVYKSWTCADNLKDIVG